MSAWEDEMRTVDLKPLSDGDPVYAPDYFKSLEHQRSVTVFSPFLIGWILGMGVGVAVGLFIGMAF